MAKTAKNPKVDSFILKAKQWQKEFEALRAIALSLPLTEAFKWGKPCYLYANGNVVLIHGFKDYCALLFFKGALLKDKNKILVQQTENVQSARQIRFTNANQIAKGKPVIKGYMEQAIEVEKSGLKLQHKKTSDFKVVDEFQKQLQALPALQKAFTALTPGRQRGYLLYFASAKQSQTRTARIEKHMKRILAGKGLDD